VGEFVLTGSATDAVTGIGTAGRTEPPGALESSVPGFFAVGDVRRGSVRRVASAVGEASVVVSAVHAQLAAEGARGAAGSPARR